jgi:hypothetical protein
MRFVWIAIGVLAVLAGLVWTLQGLNIMGGSAMSGDSTWAIVGPIVFVVGMLLFLFGVRSRSSRS